MNDQLKAAGLSPENMMTYDEMVNALSQPAPGGYVETLRQVRCSCNLSPAHSEIVSDAMDRIRNIFPTMDDDALAAIELSIWGAVRKAP